VAQRRTRAVVDLVVRAVRMELQTEVQLWSCFEAQVVQKRRLELNSAAVSCGGGVAALGHRVQREVVVELRQRLADVSN
jgi:hypothetical protein